MILNCSDKDTVTLFYLLTHHHIHAPEYHNELVKAGGLYLRLHHITICIAIDLSDGCLSQLLYLLIGGIRLAIFQLHNI